MSIAIIRISQLFADVGFSAALIQDADVTKSKFDTVFWINAGAGFTLFLLIQLSAPFIASFYEQPAVLNIVRVLAFVMLLDALSIVQFTMLKKDLNFKRINQVVIISETIAALAAIALALTGFGIWALIMETLLVSLINLILYWSFSQWRPSFHFSKPEAKGLFSFGLYVFLVQIIHRIASRFEVILIGKYFTPARLGQYNRADSFLSLVKKYSTSSVARIVYPYLSAIKANREEFTQKYKTMIEYVYFVAFMLTGFLLCIGEETILIVYGPKWLEATTYLRIIAFTTFFYPINAIIAQAFLSLGHSKLIFRLGAFFSVLRFVCLLIAIQFSFVIFLWALVAVSVLTSVCYMIAQHRMAILDFKYQLFQLVKYCLLLGVVMVLFYSLFLSTPTIEVVWQRWIAKAAFFGVAFFVISYLANRKVLIGLLRQVGIKFIR